MSKKYKNEKEAADALASIYKSLKQEIGKVIIGQEDVVEKLLIALFCKDSDLLFYRIFRQEIQNVLFSIRCLVENI